MAKVLLSIKNKISKRRKQKGISMVSLVITIIIMLILTAVAYGYSMKTVDEADYSKYVSDFSDVATAFEEKSMTVKGEKAADSNQKNIEQVYNYVAKAGKDDEEFLVISELPAYTIIKDEAQLGIELPKMTVESGTGKRVQAKFATTKNGEVFLWPPYEYEQKLYITPNNVVEHKLQTTITVGKETFEIVLDPVDGSLVDIKQDNNLPPVDEPSGDKEEHLVHEFNSKTETSKYLHSAATCTSPAVYYYKCSQCDEKGTNTYTSGVALNHNYGSYQVTKAANCGETGERKRSCSRCGDVQTQVIEKDTSKHIGGEISETTKTASCTKTGTKVYKCSTCKATLRTETIPALEHSYGEYVVTKVATCAEAGVKTKTCARCNDEQTQEIAKNSSNHTGGQVSEITKQATCTEEGTKAIKCSGCNVTLSTETIATTGHSYGSYTTVKAATCLTGGTEERKCKNCNDIQTRNVAALGHIDTNPADNSCDRCGIVIKEVPGLGDVEVSDPDLEVEYDPGTGDASGVIPPADDEPEPPAEIPEEELPEIIEFGFGNFESNTTYTPGTFQTVPYEETHTRIKFPVTYQGVVWSKWNITKDSNGNIIKVEPKEIELADIDKKYSTYILYDFETDEYLEMEGVKGDSVELWTIYNESDDTLDNIIYLAAYLNKTENNPNRHVAKWDGTKYVAVDYDAEINAIKTFTETYTVTKTKQVLVTAPSSSTEYIYVPAGTLKAEKGMTWSEWLVSDYNTTGKTSPAIKTPDFEDVSNDSVILADKDYGFMSYTLSGTWQFNDTITSPKDLFVSESISFTYEGMSNTDIYVGMYCEDDRSDDWILINYRYIDTALSNQPTYSHEVYCDRWHNTNYQTLNFGFEPQEVSKEFYEWFTANAQQYTLSGKWRFNEVVYYANRYANDTYIDFISNGVEYNCLMMEDWGIIDGFPYYLIYYSETEPMTMACSWEIPDANGESDFSWEDEAYRIVDFGTSPQSVSKKFFEWFISNATDLVATVNITNPLSNTVLEGNNFTFKYEVGMTWQDVINNSEYNKVKNDVNNTVGALDSDGTYVFYSKAGNSARMMEPLPKGWSYVKNTDIIDEDATYEIYRDTGGSFYIITNSLITFTIEVYNFGTFESTKTFQAEAGMTWTEFIQSSYNVDEYVMTYYPDLSACVYVSKYPTHMLEGAWTTSEIEDGTTYIVNVDNTHEGGTND